jgi:hypothetical protein
MALHKTAAAVPGKESGHNYSFAAFLGAFTPRQRAKTAEIAGI